jgi:glycosyltransferase involved in cell wall biosynthesis
MVNKKSWIHKCLKTTHPDSSFKFETRADWDSQRLLYGWSDFTLLPVIHSDHGLVPLMSLSMGSPVATFDIPPSNEYINKGNGILAPCQVKYDKVGLASLVPDVQRFESMVKKTLTDGDLVVNMKDHTNDYANDRKSAFIKTWRNLLN